MTTPVIDFLCHAQPDAYGRTHESILSQDDEWLEFTHDWIQWCFPLFEASQSIKGAPILSSDQEVAIVRESETGQLALAAAAARYRQFLADNAHWLKPHHHNHLRITRTIRSLRCLASDTAADEFRDFVLAQVTTRAKVPVSETTLKFWRLS